MHSHHEPKYKPKIGDVVTLKDGDGRNGTVVSVWWADMDKFDRPRDEYAKIVIYGPFGEMNIRILNVDDVIHCPINEIIDRDNKS